MVIGCRYGGEHDTEHVVGRQWAAAVLLWPWELSLQHVASPPPVSPLGAEVQDEPPTNGSWYLDLVGQTLQRESAQLLNRTDGRSHSGHSGVTPEIMLKAVLQRGQVARRREAMCHRMLVPIVYSEECTRKARACQLALPTPRTARESSLSLVV